MLIVISSKPPRLWHFRVSRYNEKVRWALDHKHWPHLRQALIPGDRDRTLDPSIRGIDAGKPAFADYVHCWA